MTVPNTAPLLAAPDLRSAVELLRSRGLRVSAARRLVLEALFVADRPIPAERIADGLSGRLPRSDLASVYRNLETLGELGLVRHFHLGHGPGLYVLTGRGEVEYLACESCGSVRAVEPRAIHEVRALIQRRFGYEASFSHFPIVGLCARCASGRQPAPTEQEAIA